MVFLRFAPSRDVRFLWSHPEGKPPKGHGPPQRRGAMGVEGKNWTSANYQGGEPPGSAAVAARAIAGMQYGDPPSKVEDGRPIFIRGEDEGKGGMILVWHAAVHT